jgi:cobyrinic acid a,c-diamide synthase
VSGAAGPAPAPGALVVAAPSSGSGKTVFTLGLLRYLSRSGVKAASAKAGPDYIDPAFHAAATGRPCLNLDPWGMGPGLLTDAAAAAARDAELLVCEGVMGLFDGATAADGSTADLAAGFHWPVVLVVDAGAQGASAAAVVQGFARFRPDVAVKAVVFNKVGPGRHAEILRDACARAVPDIPVLGCIPRIRDLLVPSRHLGLVQAVEHEDLPAFLDRAADLVAEHVDVAALKALARPVAPGHGAPVPVAPPGQRIAVARDAAFAFAYPMVLDGWRAAGAEIAFFSPLADEAPDGAADAVYLPGGYPELHGGVLAAAETFKAGVRAAAERDAAVFGECGGYMVLGEGLIDADGAAHGMVGLLGLETSFAARRLHLGYRRAVLGADGPLGAAGTAFTGHEFHYATVTREAGAPLFQCADALGAAKGPAGLCDGRVAGSFVHLIAAV